MATRYTESAQTGDQGIAFVQSIATQAGFIYRPFENADVGVDGAIDFLNNDREPSGDIVLVQVKSGPSYIKGNKYIFKADRDHFETWVRYSIPIIGIVYNPNKSNAKWVDISAHLINHPESISKGPYNIEIPDRQVFSYEGFESFKNKFRKKSVEITNVKTPPNLLIRPWKREDAKPTRALVSSIANDYPKFYDWLSKNLNKPEVSKKVVDVNGVIAAFSMWIKKDIRNVKLQTFIVGPYFQGTAVGQHLLYHELRNWAQDDHIVRVFVTISSNKADILQYFHLFGFRVEGIAANRYERATNDAEIILVKHFVHESVSNTEELKNLIERISQTIWGIESSFPGCRFGVKTNHFSLPLAVPDIEIRLKTDERTVNPRLLIKGTNKEVLRKYNDYTLMREFYPLKLYLPNKMYAVVPIRPEFSTKLFAFEGRGNETTRVKLRIDNVYYCTPRLTDLKRGDFVLFYETKSGNGEGAAFGSAVIRQIMVDSPANVWKKFGKLGVFKLSDIEEHTKDGKAMAIHFDLYEPFSKPVSLERIRKILGRDTVFQALSSLYREEFISIYEEGCPRA